MSIIHYHDSIILSAGSDGVIKFWDINDSENFKTFQAHSEILMDLCKISQRLFASSSFDNTIKIWNFESGSQSPDGNNFNLIYFYFFSSSLGGFYSEENKGFYELFFLFHLFLVKR